MANVSDILDWFINRKLSREKFYSKLGHAVNVRESEKLFDFEPLDNSAKLTDVRMQSVASFSSGFTVVPAENSFVTVGFFDKHTAFLLLCSEVEKIILIDGTDGMVEVSKLVTKMNDLENKLNAFFLHVHGAAGTPPVPPFTPLINTIKSDLENKKILQ